MGLGIAVGERQRGWGGVGRVAQAARVADAKPARWRRAGVCCGGSEGQGSARVTATVCGCGRCKQQLVVAKQQQREDVSCAEGRGAAVPE